MVEPTSTDHTPAGLADVLDQMAKATIELDREAAAILATARESMRALSWNRYVSRKNRESRRRQFVRYHKSRKGTTHA